MQNSAGRGDMLRAVSRETLGSSRYGTYHEFFVPMLRKAAVMIGHRD